MILDKGVCSVFRKTDISEPGDKPKWEYQLIYQSWYGEPDFATSPAWPTEHRAENQTDARIRILQFRGIRQHDVVVLREIRYLPIPCCDMPIYDIERAFHGYDDDGPTLITDLTLREVSP